MLLPPAALSVIDDSHVDAGAIDASFSVFTSTIRELPEVTDFVTATVNVPVLLPTVPLAPLTKGIYDSFTAYYSTRQSVILMARRAISRAARRPKG